MTGADLLFWIYALAVCGGAIGVVASQNVVRMAFWLIISLGSVSGLFFLLSADFVAATQLIIYVGGTAVLLIFGVMLTASGPYLKINTSPAECFLGAGVGVLFLGVLYMTVSGVEWEAAGKAVTESNSAVVEKPGYNPEGAGNTARPIGLALLGVRADQDLGSSAEVRKAPGYLLPFEIVSVHLLVVLVGAAYLARAKRRVTPQTDKAEG